MLPNLIRARRNAALVSIPDRRLIIIGGYSASHNRRLMEAPAWMDSVEYLLLDAPHDGWRNIAPLPEPITFPGAVHFHDFVNCCGAAFDISIDIAVAASILLRAISSDSAIAGNT